MKRMVATALVIVHVAAVGLILAGLDPLLLAGGSDLGTEVLMPPLWSQSMGFGVMVLIALAALRSAPGWRWPLAALWIMVFAASAHRLVIDRPSGEIRDTYALLTLQSIPLDAEWSLTDLVETHALWIRISTPDGLFRIVVPRGIPPVLL